MADYDRDRSKLTIRKKDVVILPSKYVSIGKFILGSLMLCSVVLLVLMVSLQIQIQQRNRRLEELKRVAERSEQVVNRTEQLLNEDERQSVEFEPRLMQALEEIAAIRQDQLRMMADQ